MENGLSDRVATLRTPSGSSTSDTRRFVTAPDGRAMGEYGGSATDVKAEYIWLSPQVGDAGVFGGDDGLGGYMPLAMALPTATVGTTQLAWVHPSHMGVPIVYTNAAGTTIPAPTGFAAMGFPGQNQTTADLYYNRHRDYDPGTGRYIQADPIGLEGGASPYSYAMNNPMRYMDPTGEFVPFAIWAAIGWGAFDAGLDYGFQRFGEGKNPDCIDWNSVGTSFAIGMLTGGIGGLGKVGQEFSHWIPGRYINPASKSYKPWLDNGPMRNFINSDWNGNRVPDWFHDKTDFWRRTPGSSVGDKWPFPIQQAARVPTWVWGPAGAAGIGATGALGGD